MASQDAQPFHWHYSELEDHNFRIKGRTLFFIVVIFSIVLLVILLYLYARWICRFRTVQIPASNSSELPPPSEELGLDPVTINNLPIILLESTTTFTTSVDESECCICLGVFRDGEKVKVLPNCGHCYHSECVDQWLTSRSSCPLCRASLRSDSAV